MSITIITLYPVTGDVRCGSRSLQIAGPLPAVMSIISFGRFEMLSIFRRVMKSEKGATAIEYTLIASLIAVAAIVAMGSVGTKVNGVLSNVASAMK